MFTVCNEISQNSTPSQRSINNSFIENNGKTNVNTNDGNSETRTLIEIPSFSIGAAIEALSLETNYSAQHNDNIAWRKQRIYRRRSRFAAYSLAQVHEYISDISVTGISISVLLSVYFSISNNFSFNSIYSEIMSLLISVVRLFLSCK